MQVLSAAVAWQVYEITQSAFALGIVGLVQFAPMFALTLYAGDVADRFERRLVLVLANLVEATCAAALILLTLAGTTAVEPFYATLALFGCARAFSGPASQSFLPQIVPPEDLPRAIALSSSVFQVAVISGPALGGAALYFGPAAAYAIGFALFVVFAFTVYLIKVELAPRHAASSTSVLERVREGLSYVRRRRELFGAISLDLFAVLLGGATALLPIYARDILHVGPLGFGLLRAAPAVGAAVTSIYLSVRPLGGQAGAKMFACVAIFGIATIVFGLSENFYLSLAALIVLGASDMVSVNVRHSLTQLATPDHMRGRVSSVSMLFIGASNELGEFRAGLVAHWWGAVPAVIVGGLGTLGIVAAWAYLFPELRKVDRLTDLKP